MGKDVRTTPNQISTFSSSMPGGGRIEKRLLSCSSRSSRLPSERFPPRRVSGRSIRIRVPKFNGSSCAQPEITCTTWSGTVMSWSWQYGEPSRAPGQTCGRCYRERGLALTCVSEHRLAEIWTAVGRRPCTAGCLNAPELPRKLPNSWCFCSLMALLARRRPSMSAVAWTLVKDSCSAAARSIMYAECTSPCCKCSAPISSSRCGRSLCCVRNEPATCMPSLCPSTAAPWGQRSRSASGLVH